MQYTNCNNIENARKKWTALLFTTLLSQVTNASPENKKEVYDVTKRVERDVYSFAVKHAHTNECGHAESSIKSEKNRNLNTANNSLRLEGKSLTKIVGRNLPNQKNRGNGVVGVERNIGVGGVVGGEYKIGERKIVRNLLISQCNSVLENIYIHSMNEKINMITNKVEQNKRKTCECDESFVLQKKRTKIEDKSNLVVDKPPVFTIVPKKPQSVKKYISTNPPGEKVTGEKVSSEQVHVEQELDSSVLKIETLSKPTIIPFEANSELKDSLKKFNICTCTGKDHVGTDYGYNGCNCDCGYINCSPCQGYEMWRILASLQPVPETKWDTNDEAYKLLFG